MLSTLVEFLVELLLNIFSILPKSPFGTFITFVDDYNVLAAMNYFVPFDICAGIAEAWVATIAAIYLYKNMEKILKLFGL